MAKKTSKKSQTQSKNGPQRPPASPTRERRSSAPWLVVAVLLALAVGGVAWWLTREPAEREATPETRAALEAGLEALGERRYDDGIDLLRAHLVTEPDAVGVHHLLGVLHGANGEHQEAVDELQIALEKDPESADTLFNLGLAHSALGEQETANDSFRRALDLDPQRADAALLLGQNAKLRGETDLAAAFFQRAAESAQAKGRYAPTAWFELGLIQRQRGELDAAASSMRQVLEGDPDHLGALLNLGQILQRQDKDVESRQLLARHQELARSADELDLLQRTSQLETADSEDFLKLGRFHLERGDLRRAAEAFEGALAKEPDQLEALIGLGRSRLDAGDVPGARSAFGRAVEAHPDEFEAHFFFGLASHLAGDIDTARRAIYRSQDLGTWGAREYTFLGNVFLATGLAADAEAAYRRALEIDPQRDEAWYRLAWVTALLDKPEDTATALDEVLERQPGDGDSLLLAGIVRWKLDQRDDAEILLRKATIARRVNRFGAAADDASLARFESLPGAEEPLARYRELRELALAGVPDAAASASDAAAADGSNR